MLIASDDDIITVIVEFRVYGNIRFLSHIETMRVLQRSCVRAGFCLVYGQGFNPHPKLSLLLPRPVGVEADRDCFCVQISTKGQPFEAGVFKDELTRRLPAGLEPLSVEATQSGKSLVPVSASYVFPIEKSILNSDLRSRALTEAIKTVIESKSLVLQRRFNEKGTVCREIDVRPFIEMIEQAETGVAVVYRIANTGTVRIGEIMGLLGINNEDLAGPIRRTGVQWQRN